MSKVKENLSLGDIDPRSSYDWAELSCEQELRSLMKDYARLKARDSSSVVLDLFAMANECVREARSE